jgi:2',3'-cyclic-nucleotide 2'-phosphodiesterase (5'-nucleotidase family)
VETLTVNGEPLNPDKIYSVATSRYLANGGDGFSDLRAAFDPSRTTDSDNILMTDLLIREIIRQQTIHVKTDGRILDLAREINRGQSGEL